MDNKNKKYGILIPPFISIIIIMGIYLIKKIYPFGSMTVAQADLSSYTIIIKYILDALKSKEFGNLIFTDLIFGGTNIISVISNLNPFLIIYFLCRNTNKLLFFMSFVMIIKIALCSITSYICFDKIFGRQNLKLNIIFSLLYAFSSYVLINHTTLFWIEIVILFPLLILGLKNIFEKQSFFLYSIVLSICIGTSYQLVYMILLSIIFTTVVAFLIYDQLENKKKIITALGIGTLLGIMMASVIILPTIKNFFDSARTTLNNIEVNSNVFSTKLSYILFSAILIYPFIESLKKICQDKDIKFLIIMIIITAIIPICFEGVNLIFHGGQYDQFPFRYGFIPLFFMNILANHYYKNNLINDSRRKANGFKGYGIFFIAAYIFAVVISYVTSISNPTFGTYFGTVIILIIYNFFMYIFLNCFEKSVIENAKSKFDILLLLTIIEISIFSFGFIGIEKEYRGRAHSDVTILNGMEIIEELDGKLDYDSGYRYKDFDNLMIENTSLFTKLPSTSAWIYSNEEQVNSYTKLGYSQLYMRLNNTNGTILSDSILGMKYVLTQKKLDERIYNYISETNTSKIKLYEVKEYLPIGIVYDKNKDIEEIPPNMNHFEYQNWIYKNLFDKSSNIFECINPIIKSTNSQYLESENIIIEDKNNSKNAYVEYEVTVDKPEILYFFTTDDLEKGSICIEVNGELLNISSTNDLKNIYYPASYNNGILNLGYYDNEIVKIKIYFWDNINLNYLKFAKFDYSKYKELCKSKIDTKYKCDENIITIETNVGKDKRIFIPITYDKNWKAIVNGQQVSVQKALGGMISVGLEEGYNEIKLIYTNSLIKIGAIITVISIMLFIILDKFKDKILNIKILNNIFYYAFVIVSVILIIYVYFWGLISTFL